MVVVVDMDKGLTQLVASGRLPWERSPTELVGRFGCFAGYWYSQNPDYLLTSPLLPQIPIFCQQNFFLDSVHPQLLRFRVFEDNECYQ